MVSFHDKLCIRFILIEWTANAQNTVFVISHIRSNRIHVAKMIRYLSLKAAICWDPPPASINKSQLPAISLILDEPFSSPT